MLERMMNMERPCGEPKYSAFSREAERLKRLLHSQLDQEGQGWLDQLTDACIRQENAALGDAFAEGFWTAVELMQEYENWKRSR